MNHTSHTKVMLAKSLKDLMTRIPFGKITVQNVTDNCALNRQTFYYHFKDMYELLAWIYEYDIFNEVRKESYNDWEVGVQHVLRYANANKCFCRNTVRSVKKEYIESTLLPIIHRWVEIEGNLLVRTQRLSIHDEEFFVRFFSMAFVDYMIEWIRRGMIEDDSSIMDKIHLLISLMDNRNEYSKVV